MIMRRYIALTSCLYTHDDDDDEDDDDDVDDDDDDEEDDVDDEEEEEEDYLECGEVRQKVGSCARKVRLHCP